MGVRRLAALAASVVCVGAVQAQGTHVVRPGETLWDISRQHMQSPLRWPELQRKNAVPIPRRLQAGRVLQLSNAPQASPAARKTAAPRAPAVAGSGSVAAVVELVGTAWLKRGNAEPSPLAIGVAVEAGDVLITDKEAFLCLGTAGGSRLVMPSSSAVRVLAADDQATRLQLLGGRIEAYVEKQHGREFEIRNRRVGLSVRGTHFRARDEDGAATAEVIEGSVSVSNDDRQVLMLDAGRGALLAGAGAFEARTLAPPPQRARDHARGVLALPVPQAQAYRKQLAGDDRFLHVVHDALSKEGGFALPNGIDAGFYHLRLTALDAQQIEGMPGESIVYVRGSAPPANSRRMEDGRYEIRWPARGQQQYVFELARTPAFMPVLANIRVASAGGVIVGPFDVPGTYHWRSRELVAAEGEAASVHEGSFEVPAPPAAGR